MPSVVIVGAGAAGLVAAIVAAARGPVTVIERTRDGGRKILISGGGRCNILPTVLDPHRFVTASPGHLLRGLLRAWPLAAQREFFEREVGVPLVVERASGKLFPVSNQARDVRDGLVALARWRGVQFRFETALTDLTPVAGGWQLDTTGGAVEAQAVVLATGGLSVPATGSDGTGLRLSNHLGHVVHDTYPALAPLTAEPAVHAILAGVSLPVRLRAKWRGRTLETSGGFLFTHRGYSGPAVLDVSHTAVRSRSDRDGAAESAVIRIAWSTMGAAEWKRDLDAATGRVATVLAQRLPHRLAAHLLTESGVPQYRRSAELRRSERSALIEALTAYVLPWTGDEGYRKAEVTGGGVALDAVHPRTLESRHHSGLFLCGEMLDAFGPIGGHNFAWAWATGRAAGLGATRASQLAQ
jgi:predicted Rossmann fold flavoprotein